MRSHALARRQGRKTEHEGLGEEFLRALWKDLAIVRAIGADPIKLLRDLMAGKPPAKPRRASAK
jgi:hypothetical protein